jgi:hypothetical protein
MDFMRGKEAHQLLRHVFIEQDLQSWA